MRWAALALAVLFIFVAGWWLLPRVIDALPGEIRARVPEQLLAALSTPLPTALPAPEGLVQAPAEPMLLLPSDLTSTLTPAWPAPTESTMTLEVPATATPTAAATQSQELRDEPSVEPTPVRLNETPSPTATANIPPSAMVSGLTIIPQKFNNCGPANLTMVLNYYGHEVDQLSVGALIKPNYDDRNVSPDELVAYVNSETGLRAGAFSGGDLELIKRLIVAGYPAIIEKGLEPSEWQGWMGHYLTLVGFDEPTQTLLAMDTYLGPWDGSGRREEYGEVEEFWAQFNHTFILVYPPEREEELMALLGPRFRDPETMWQAAGREATIQIQAAPEDAFAWFNLGTNLTRLAEVSARSELYARASTAYDRARQLGLPWRMLWYQFDPYVAYLAAGRFEDVLTLTEATLSNSGGRDVEETYLYRGYALQALGNTAQARAAYLEAIELNPNLVQARLALEALESVSGDQ
jgi:hypothetical protein